MQHFFFFLFLLSLFFFVSSIYSYSFLKELKNFNFDICMNNKFGNICNFNIELIKILKVDKNVM
jgi:hypothetical protein